MKKAIRFEEEMANTRSAIVETILEHLEAAKAKEVELTGASIVVQEIDDQFSQTIDRVSDEGVTVQISYGEEENWNFEDLPNNYLISVLEKLETNEFEVYEDSAEQEG